MWVVGGVVYGAADGMAQVNAFDRYPCLLCHKLHASGECGLLTEPLQVMLPEWLDKLFRARVPKGERSAYIRGLLERELS